MTVDRLVNDLADECRARLADVEGLFVEVETLRAIAVRASVEHELPDLLVIRRRLECQRTCILAALESLSPASATIH
jgi:hypothetical protein